MQPRDYSKGLSEINKESKQYIRDQYDHHESDDAQLDDEDSNADNKQQDSSDMHQDGDDQAEEDQGLPFAEPIGSFAHNFCHSGRNITGEDNVRGNQPRRNNEITQAKGLYNDSHSERQQMSEMPSTIIKRGKGRPRGSRNKHKQLRNQGLNVHHREPDTSQIASQFGKRGKGRPIGSKNRIKIEGKKMSEMSGDNLFKRGRGRPKGVRNKVPESVSNDKDLERRSSDQPKSFDRPNLAELDNLHCCSRCHEKKLKLDLMKDRVSVEEVANKLWNLSEDITLQSRRNVLLDTIKQGDLHKLKRLLEVADRMQPSYRPPWAMDKAFERTPFCVKTKKTSLSKNGKEGLYVLLHDSGRKRQIWWREIGIQRIIDSIPQNQNGQLVMELLCSSSHQLKTALYDNLCSFIRIGNVRLAKKLLHQTLNEPRLNKAHYLLQHEYLLTANKDACRKLKKSDLIQHNEGQNYCSPIHCAAICEDSIFLSSLLTIFTDVVNTQDSMLRRPVHYACLAKTNLPQESNLKALYDKFSELKVYDIDGRTPLMLACLYGHANNIAFLLQKIRDSNFVNCRSKEGYAAIHYAILGNQPDCVQLLLNDPLIELSAETSDRESVFHLLAWTGNIDILGMFIQKGLQPTQAIDRYQRTPAMFAIRNHHLLMLDRLLREGCDPRLTDSSQNSLLHYAAAYGNIQAIAYLQPHLTQNKNKRGIFPWQIALLKGHIGCVEHLVGGKADQQEEDTLYMLLAKIRGTSDYLSTVKYVLKNYCPNPQHVDKETGNTYLHLVCRINYDQYKTLRISQCLDINETELQTEYWTAQTELNRVFVELGLDSTIENRRKQSPLKLCVQNDNLAGLMQLLTGTIDFEIQASAGTTILHSLANLACKGPNEMGFVKGKIQLTMKNNSVQLQRNLKKIDQNGFDFLLYLVKSFTQRATIFYHQRLTHHTVHGPLSVQLAHRKAIEEFEIFQKLFIVFVGYLTQNGCDINAHVHEQRVKPVLEPERSYKKWGLQHFLMKFPSLRLLRFFKAKIRDFNLQNGKMMSPLHIFCQQVKQGNLFQSIYAVSDDYDTQLILEYLLKNGLNPNYHDSDKALPLLYAALNAQYCFIKTLIRYKSQINFCSAKNQVPLIEMVRYHQRYTLSQFQQMLELGADPNFTDMDKRTSLHHLVYSSSNFDQSPQLCRKLLEYRAKINALDKYQRSPIFYCFARMQYSACYDNNDHAAILQLLVSLPDTKLNQTDVYYRNIVHYACQRNSFYSLLHLLQGRNVNVNRLDHEGNTPLAICLKNGHLEEATILIEHGVTYGVDGDLPNTAIEPNKLSANSMHCQMNTRLQSMDIPQVKSYDASVAKISYFQCAYQQQSLGICFLLIDHGYPIQKALKEVDSQAFKQVLIKYQSQKEQTFDQV